LLFMAIGSESSLCPFDHVLVQSIRAVWLPNLQETSPADVFPILILDFLSSFMNGE
jgi:hypothetical protein